MADNTQAAELVTTRKRVKRRGPSGPELAAPRFANPDGSSPNPAVRPNVENGDTSEAVAKRDAASGRHEPPVPTSVLPPHLDHRKEQYSFASMSIISSSKIETKVTTLLNHLARFDGFDRSVKPGVVALYAKAPVANKLVSVIEIAKRSLQKDDQRLYQYSQLSSELVALGHKADRREQRAQGTSAKSESGLGPPVPPDGDDEDEGDEPAFEPMDVPQAKRVRAVPVLTVYLSRVSVKELAAEFGYGLRG